MRRTTQTQQPTLFEQLISKPDKVKQEQEKQIKVSNNNQSQQSTSNTQSLQGQQTIEYQNTMDYQNYKLTLRYNDKNLKKIVIQNINNPHKKIIKILTKYNLSNLEELTLENIDILDTQFKIFQQRGGIQKQFQNLIRVTFNCPNITTLSIDYLFQGLQNIQYLDLSHTKIDNQGIYNLSQLKWPFLETFVIQWCNKVDNLDEIGENAENFPNLKIIDSRFIQTENEAYNTIINSKISITLNHLRLYGTNVNLQTAFWKSTYLLNLFMNTMKDYKFQEFRIQNTSACVSSSSDYKQMKVNIVCLFRIFSRLFMQFQN